jgi:uncharacterized OsmC-like protein
MATQEVALALQRAKAVLAKRPQAALHADPAATARWMGGTRVHSLHGSGSCVPSDMPAEVGGSGDQLTPGWLFRAGLGACTVTCIALIAAERQIGLARLEIETSSCSDARGLLGMNDDSGAPVSAASRELTMQVRVAAPGSSEAELRALVAEGLRRSPIYCAVCAALPIEVQISVAGS